MSFKFKFAVPRRAKRILLQYAKKDRQPDIDPWAVELLRQKSDHENPGHRPKHFVIQISALHRFDLCKSVQGHFHVWCHGFQHTVYMGCQLWLDFDDWQDYLVSHFRVEHWHDGTWFREDFLDKLARGALPKMRPKSQQRQGVDYIEVPSQYLAELFNPHPLVYLQGYNKKKHQKKKLFFWETEKLRPKKTVLTPDWKHVPRPVALDPSRTDFMRKETTLRTAAGAQMRDQVRNRRLRKELGLPRRMAPASTPGDLGSKKYWHEKAKRVKRVLKPLPDGQKRSKGRPPKSAYLIEPQED
jgi:hypothetical protein